MRILAVSFIDDALLNSNTGEDFVNAMADIYSNSDVRDILDNYPEWIRDIICIIDYDTDLQMEGLLAKSYDFEIKVLMKTGMTDEAEALSNLNENSNDSDLENCYCRLAICNDYDLFWEKVYSYAADNLELKYNEIVQLDLNDIESGRDFQMLLKNKMNFPDFYGLNWDAFWDAITGLGKLPRVIEITGWERMTNKLPHDAQMFNKLLDEYNEQYGVIYNNICEIVYK